MPCVNAAPPVYRRICKYLYAVVSWFGLEAEHALVVALDCADRSLVTSFP